MPSDIARRIREKLDHIATDPHTKHPNVTKLQNRSGYRLRVGDWRAIYEIGDELIIIVLRVGPRGEVYR